MLDLAVGAALGVQAVRIVVQTAATTTVVLVRRGKTLAVGWATTIWAVSEVLEKM